MSKKKKKKWFGTPMDDHHIFYTRTAWIGMFPNKLRQHWYCIVKVPKTTVHHAIHQEVRYVPVPRDVNIMDALEHLDSLSYHGAISENDTVEKRLAVLINLFDCVEKPTADALRKQLEAINKNKPSD